MGCCDLQADIRSALDLVAGRSGDAHAQFDDPGAGGTDPYAWDLGLHSAPAGGFGTCPATAADEAAGLGGDDLLSSLLHPGAAVSGGEAAWAGGPAGMLYDGLSADDFSSGGLGWDALSAGRDLGLGGAEAGVAAAEGAWSIPAASSGVSPDVRLLAGKPRPLARPGSSPCARRSAGPQHQQQAEAAAPAYPSVEADIVSLEAALRSALNDL